MDSLLTSLKTGYFLWHPFNSIKGELSTALGQFSEDEREAFQKLLLDELILGPFASEHPVHPQFRSKYLKSLILLLESLGMEVHDRIYEEAVDSHGPSSDPEKYPQKSYFKNGKHLCSLIETRELVCEGTTGLRTWEAARALTGYTMDNLELLEGADSIVELGAGLGFVGISLLRSDSIKKAILTDVHPKVMKALTENGRINFPEMSEKDMGNYHEFLSTDQSLILTPWDWSSDEVPDPVLDIKPKIALAADVVFDPSILDSLVKTVKNCLYHFASKVVIACTVRNPETLKKFRGHLQEEEFMIKETDISYDDHSTVIAFTIINVRK